MKSDYYELDNGKQIVQYIFDYKLGFAYGNAAKYLCRAGRKEGNTSESDLNKALVYVTSVNDELTLPERLALKVRNTFLFNSQDQMCEHHLAKILKSIIKFDDYKKVAKLIVKYADWRGINVKSEFRKYA